MDTSKSSSDDPDPDAFRAEDSPTYDYGPATPPGAKPDEPGASAMKKEKGRVRFNSNAAHTVEPAKSAPEPAKSPVVKPRPSVLRGNSAGSVITLENIDEHADLEAQRAQARAQERARQVAERLRKEKANEQDKQRPSVDSVTGTLNSDGGDSIASGTNIPLQDLGGESAVASSVDDLEAQTDVHWKEEAYDLVRTHTRRAKTPELGDSAVHNEAVEWEEVNDGFHDGVYEVPVPQHYRGSVLSQLLKLYKPPEAASAHHRRNSSNSSGGPGTPGSDSGMTTPKRKWYDQQRASRSQETLANLIAASARLANPNDHQDDQQRQPRNNKRRSFMHSRNGSRSGSRSRFVRDLHKEEARITVHIAETLVRQDYIIKLCRALMLYGAPTHRLEEYLSMTARVLEIDGQFLYLPGCMVVSFDDRSTHTTEVRIVRTAQGIDLGRLKDVHLIYKEVMHDVIGADEGMRKLDHLMKQKNRFGPWFRVLIFGLTSVAGAPFSFHARLIDLPLCFVFGAMVGLLQLIVAPKSLLYNNVFEVSATVLVSFLARAFGSIRGGDLFCFSSLAQGGIMMLLPGYTVLCSSLELQSRAIVPGSIRTVYAIIYSLLLGFGITIGASLYGLMDGNATSSTTCANPIPPYLAFIFVPFFNICVCILYQAKWSQMPIMVVISFAGYVVNYFSGLRFAAAPQIANTLGAFAVGVLANLYSRLRHGVAAAILIPAIFTQVPGGLASNGGLLSGLSTANLLTNHRDNGTDPGTTDYLNGVVFNVAASMIQIAIGIAVGLFLSALLIYPLGKRRSGLFSF